MAQRMNNHHRIPKSREKDGYKVHHKDNQWLMNQRIHECIHNLFNNLCPHEQIEKLLEINSQVINKKIKKQILELIRNQDFYLPHLLCDGNTDGKHTRRNQ